MKPISILRVVLLALIFSALPVLSQTLVPPARPADQPWSDSELDQMLGPIALYPDPLIAQILPAAAIPSELVMADRYVSGGGDPNLIDAQDWDSSLKALARYPAVLKWMDDNLPWTTALGQAFLYQQQDVMDSIQRLRSQAQALGNLESTPQENVIIDDGAIEIAPADPQVIYVPVYEPGVVYYQRHYGSPFISFGVGFAIGTWFDHDFDWHNHHVIAWDRDRPRPANWWNHRSNERPRVDHLPVWRPPNRPVFERSGIDRGRDFRPRQSPAVAPGGQVRPVERHENPHPAPAPAPVRRSEPVIVRPSGEVSRPRPASGALIGVQSSRQTQQYSNRGQQSRQVVVSHPAAPAPHPAAPQHAPPPSHSSGPRKP